MPASNWWDNYENIVVLTKYMADNGSESTEIAYAVEKPWKFEEEFEAATSDEELEDSE